MSMPTQRNLGEHISEVKQLEARSAITYPNHFGVGIYFLIPIHLFYKQVFFGSYSLVQKSPLMWLIGMTAKAVKKNAVI